MFLGSYNSKIDSKFRLVMPSRFAALFGDKAVFMTSLREYALLYDEDTFLDFSDKVVDKYTGKEKMRVKRYLYANTFDQALDKQRRLLLPINFRKTLSLEENVTLLGTNNRIEMWNTSKINSESNLEELKLIREQLMAFKRDEFELTLKGVL